MFRFEVIVSNIRRINKIMTFNNLNVSEKRVKKPNFHLAYYLVNYYSTRIYSGARKYGVHRFISGSHIITSVEYTHRC